MKHNTHIYLAEKAIEFALDAVDKGRRYARETHTINGVDYHRISGGGGLPACLLYEAQRAKWSLARASKVKNPARWILSDNAFRVSLRKGAKLS